MLESYVVGATFTVRDESQATLAAIERRITQIDTFAKAATRNLSAMAAVRFTGVSNSLGGMEKRLLGISQRSANFAQTMTTSLASVDASVLALSTSVAGLTTQLAAAATAASALGRGGVPGSPLGGKPPAGSSRPRSGGGPHVGFSERMGPLHVRSGVGVGLGLAGAALYGAYEEAGVEDVAARLIYTSGKPISGDVTKTNDFKQIRELIQSTTASGYSPSDVGDALMSGTQLLSDTSMSGGKRMSFDQMMALQKMVMPMAITETRLKKGTSLDEALESFIRLPHMAGEFDPDKIQEMARQFAYVSTKTDVPLPRFTNALSYSLPVLHGELGMDPGSVMVATAAMQRAGITNTKSGTWLREFMLRGMPGSGRLTGHAQKQQDEARKMLGLVDAKGNSTFLVDKDGKPTKFVKGQEQNIDWQASMLKESGVLQATAQKRTPLEMAQLERKVFGAQGGGLAALEGVTAFVAQLASMQENMKNFKPGEDFLANYSKNSSLQQGRETIGDFKNVLMDIGTVTLPLVTGALRGFDGVLKDIRDVLPKGFNGNKASDTMRDNIKGMEEGFKKGGVLGAVVGGLWSSGKSLFGSTLAGPVSGLADGLSKAKDPWQMLFDGPSLPPSAKAVGPVATGKGTPAVTINTLTIQTKTDDPQAHADAVVGAVNKALAKSGAHNLGGGEGSWQSPYTDGGSPY